MNRPFLSSIKQFMLTLVLVTALPAVAAEHGGAPAGPEPMQFLVNIGNSMATLRYLQVTIVLEFAKPEIAHRVAEIKPKVQHRIILLLSGEEAESLQTTNGKKELQARLIKELNELIDEAPNSGIKDVYFTNFIIQ